MSTAALKALKAPWYRQAFFQFVVGALFLFVLDKLLYPADDANIIRADDAALLNFMQVSQKSFDPTLAQAKYQRLSDEQRTELKQRFVESEILYREALSLGLDEYDYLIRSRMIQKMDYLMFGSVAQQKQYPEAALRAWYQQQIDDYRVSAKATFTHIFFSAHAQTEQAARAQAEQVRMQLSAQNIGPALAHRFGERFYFHRDYVDKDAELIASHFGGDFKDAVLAAEVEQWSAPIKSKYGYHVVYLDRITKAYLPRFDEVAPAVLADYERIKRHEQRQQAIAKLAEQYQVLEQ